MSFAKFKKAVLRSLVESKTKSEPLSIAQANAGLGRVFLSDYLQYSEFADGFMFSAVGDELNIGFGFQLHGSYLKAGDRSAFELENIIKDLPVDSVIHVCELGWDGFTDNLDTWETRQAKYCKSEMVLKMNRYRKQMLETAAYDPLHKQSNLRIKANDRYVFVSVPFKGSVADSNAVMSFIDKCVVVRDSIRSSIESASLGPVLLNRRAVLRLLRKLANPHLKQKDLELGMNDSEGGGDTGLAASFKDEVVRKDTAVELLDDGTLLFSDSGTNVCAAVQLTVDHYPDTLHPTAFGELTGNMLDRDERINNMYYMYTNIHVTDMDKAKEKVELSLGILSKQANESSEWLKKTLPHIFKRARNSEAFLGDLATGAVPVRMYTGITLFGPLETIRGDSDKLTTKWSSKGFKFSKERHIAFPIWCASLPWQYRPEWDAPREGLSRAKLCKAINASSVFPVTADWQGNVPSVEADAEGNRYVYSNGIPFVTGRGNISYLDIFKSETNYNFMIIATSGAGKSFFANDILRDVFSRDGMAFVIDMGGSYKDICTILGGTNLDFPVTKPFSVNHFWGIKNIDEYREFKDSLEESLESMAFAKHAPGNDEHSSVVNGLEGAYRRYQDKLGVKEIYEYFMDLESHNDPLLPKIAGYFRKYAIGDDSIWFNGPPQVDLSNPFTLLELNELENSPSLRRVIFTTILMLITRRIYSGDRSAPKILLIDEAWLLLADDRAAPFIEKAFRTIRKYFGAAGVITQSASDVNISKAALAAFNNSAWRFFLAQKESSISEIKERELLGKNSRVIGDILETVKRRDNFSEVLVEHEGLFMPMRFFVDRYSSFVYSSKAQDNALIEKKAKELGVTRSEAMEIVAGLKDA